MPEDLTRLPKWAQYRIRNSEERAEKAERELARAIEPEAGAESKVALRSYVGPSIALPEDRRVEFSVPGGTIVVELEGRDVSVRGDSGVQHQLVAMPVVGNVVRLGFRED